MEVLSGKSSAGSTDVTSILYHLRKKSFFDSLTKSLVFAGNDDYIQYMFNDPSSVLYIPNRICEIVERVLRDDRELFIGDLIQRVNAFEAYFGPKMAQKIESIGNRILEVAQSQTHKEAQQRGSIKVLREQMQSLQSELLSTNSNSYIAPSFSTGSVIMSNSAIEVVSSLKSTIDNVTSEFRQLKVDTSAYYETIRTQMSKYKAQARRVVDSSLQAVREAQKRAEIAELKLRSAEKSMRDYEGIRAENMALHNRHNSQPSFDLEASNNMPLSASSDFKSVSSFKLYFNQSSEYLEDKDARISRLTKDIISLTRDKQILVNKANELEKEVTKYKQEARDNEIQSHLAEDRYKATSLENERLIKLLADAKEKSSHLVKIPEPDVNQGFIKELSKKENEISELQSRLSDVEHELSTAKEENMKLIALSKSVDFLKGLRQSPSEKLNEGFQNLKKAELRRSLDEQIGINTELQNINQIMAKRLRDTEITLARISAENTTAQNRLRACIEDQKALRTENNKQKTKLRQMNLEMEVTKKALDKSQRSIEDAEMNLEKATDAVSVALNEKKLIEERCQELEARITKNHQMFRENLTKVQEMLDEANANLSECKSSKLEVASQLVEANDTIRRKENDVIFLEAKVRQYEDVMESLKINDPQELALIIRNSMDDLEDYRLILSVLVKEENETNEKAIVRLVEAGKNEKFIRQMLGISLSENILDAVTKAHQRIENMESTLSRITESLGLSDYSEVIDAIQNMKRTLFDYLNRERQISKILPSTSFGSLPAFMAEVINQGDKTNEIITKLLNITHKKSIDDAVYAVEQMFDKERKLADLLQCEAGEIFTKLKNLLSKHEHNNADIVKLKQLLGENYLENTADLLNSNSETAALLDSILHLLRLESKSEIIHELQSIQPFFTKSTLFETMKDMNDHLTTLSQTTKDIHSLIGDDPVNTIRQLLDTKKTMKELEIITKSNDIVSEVKNLKDSSTKYAEDCTTLQKMNMKSVSELSQRYEESISFLQKLLNCLFKQEFQLPLEFELETNILYRTQEKMEDYSKLIEERSSILARALKSGYVSEKLPEAVDFIVSSEIDNIKRQNLLKMMDELASLRDITEKERGMFEKQKNSLRAKIESLQKMNAKIMNDSSALSDELRDKCWQLEQNSNTLSRSFEKEIRIREEVFRVLENSIADIDLLKESLSPHEFSILYTYVQKMSI